MDKKDLMRRNVASILNNPEPAAEPEKKPSSTVPHETPKYEARGRRRRPRTEEEAAARRNAAGEWDKEKSYTTSFVFDYDQYVEMEGIADAERLSKKAALRELLALGLEEYRRRGGFR